MRCSQAWRVILDRAIPETGGQSQKVEAKFRVPLVFVPSAVIGVREIIFLNPAHDVQLAEMAIDGEVDLGMTGNAYPLAARLYVRPAGNDPKAAAYLAANCLLLWRR